MLNLSALQQIKPIVTPNPVEGVLNMAALKSQMLGDQLKGLQIQGAQSELQANQLAGQQAQQIREIVAKHGGDIESALPEINQINPSAGAAMLKTFSDIKNVNSEISNREATQKETVRHNEVSEGSAAAKNVFDMLKDRLNLQKETKEINGRIMGFNPETAAYDLDQGPATPKTPPAVKTVNTEEGVFVVNPDGSLGNRLGSTPKPTAAEVPDFQSAISTTRSGMKYIDTSKYTGTAKNAVTIAADKAGVPAVSKDVADMLSEIDTARENLDFMNQTIAPFLAKGPTGRPLVALDNTIEKAAQTNPDLAAVGTYRSAAIQAMRAVAGAKGLRINRAEIEQAQENDIPKMTDTLPTAQTKLKNMLKFLDNAEKAHLVKDRSAAGQANDVNKAIDDALDAVLGKKKP